MYEWNLNKDKSYNGKIEDILLIPYKGVKNAK